MSTLLNYDLRWNNFAYAGFTANVLYINEALGRLKARETEDELDELLFSFEQVLTMCRAVGELPDSHVANERFESACREQLAKYALWRAFLLHGQGRIKEAEDCFLMARIIHPTIAEDACWQQLEQLIESNDAGATRWLEEYFTREEPSDAPKWPMGGPFTQLWQYARQLCSREKKSRFSE